MAIRILVSNSTLLLKDIKELIDKGDISYWKYDSDNDYYIENENGEVTAWFTPYLIGEKELVLGIIGSNASMISKEVYSSYHSSFINILIRYYNRDISKIELILHDNHFDTTDIER